MNDSVHITFMYCLFYQYLSLSRPLWYLTLIPHALFFYIPSKNPLASYPLISMNKSQNHNGEQFTRKERPSSKMDQ